MFGALEFGIDISGIDCWAAATALHNSSEKYRMLFTQTPKGAQIRRATVLYQNRCLSSEGVAIRCVVEV